MIAVVVVTVFVGFFAGPYAVSAARRREWSGALAALVFLAVMAYAASAAHAATVSINGPWWAQRAVDEMRAPVVPNQTLILGGCPGWPGLAACNFPTPDSPIYIDRRYYNREALARELGGRFDALAMTPAARHHFVAIMRYRGPWWSTDPTLTGNLEIFEDSYADCALGIARRRETLQRPDNHWIGWAGYEPTPRQHARVCALITRTGLRVGLRAPVRPVGDSAWRGVRSAASI